jgi:hypothetical protein
MSLYNMLFGRNPIAPLYLAFLGLSQSDVGRFRDCFVQQTDEGELRIVIYTRNGGGNREEYEDVTEALRAHPQFVTDFDDEFDCTYASYVFKVPPEFDEAVKTLVTTLPDQAVDPGARFQKLIGDLQANKTDDPKVKRALEVGEQILAPILKQLEEKKESK